MVFGNTFIGQALFYLVQLATMLILYTGGNTSFNGFPFLTSYVAGDSFLPRWLLKRGHRLVFSNAIIVLDGHLGRAPGHQGRGRQQPGAAVRDRRLHRVHDGRLRHGQVPPHPARAGLAAEVRHQLLGRGPVADRRHHLRGGEVHRGRLGRAGALRHPGPRPHQDEHRVPGRGRGARDGDRRAAAAATALLPAGGLRPGRQLRPGDAGRAPLRPVAAADPDPRRALRHRQRAG